MPIVEKHGLWSRGTYWPFSFRASVNSFSNAARNTKPWPAARSIIRVRKLRGQASHGVPSSVVMSQSSRAACGTYGRNGERRGIGREPDLADRPERALG